VPPDPAPAAAPTAPAGGDADAADRRAPLGRPRAEDRTPAILEAAKALLGEVGYDRLRIQDVADRAGAGLATLYRRWPTKQALILDAIRYHAEVAFPPVLDDPRADLLSVYQAMTEKMCGGGEGLPGLLAAMRTEPQMAEVVREQVMAPLRERVRADLVRLVGDRPRLDLLVDVGPALLMFRTVVLGETPSDDLFEGIIDVVTAQATASPRREPAGTPA
jgi:AcrR family transcriptional regulator